MSEKTLRTADGKKAIDPVTGTGRRVDHVVIKDGRGKPIEVTSKTANKDIQLAKEARIRDVGGKYIRDNAGNQVELDGISEIKRVK